MVARTSRYSPNMPVFHTPVAAHARSASHADFLAAPRFPLSISRSETAAAQVTTGTDLDSHETRKRVRPDEHQSPEAYPKPSCTTTAVTTQHWEDSALGFSRFSSNKSPPPLANERYDLAGGGLNKREEFNSRHADDYDDYFALQKQRGMWSIPPTPQTALKQLAVDGMPITPGGTRPWTLMGLVGGVAGKLFEFCTVPFRGFQAGGGQKYNVDSQSDVAAKLGLQDDPFLAHPVGGVQRVTPGGFPQEDYGVMSVDSLASEQSQALERPRMTKRLRTGENWVVVGENGETESRPSTPRLSDRRLPGSNARHSPSHIPRPVSRAENTTPSLKRPSLIPVSRRSATGRRSYYGSPAPSSSHHARQRSYSRQSSHQPISSSYNTHSANDAFSSFPPTTSSSSFQPPSISTASSKTKSPLPKSSLRLINRVRRDELEDDARMRRMSSQMSAMLREAQEALGSRVEVEGWGGDDDEAGLDGWGDVGGEPRDEGYGSGGRWFT